MNQRRINIGKPIALLGVLLLLISLFLAWFEIPGDDGITAWTAFEALDLVLAAIGVAALVIVGSHLLRRPSPISERWEPALASAALVIVGAGILNHPPAATGLDQKVGAWLALAGAVLFVAGSLVGRARISISMSFDEPATRAQTRPAEPAPPASPPPVEAPTERL